MNFMLGYSYYHLGKYEESKRLLTGYSGRYRKKGESYFAGVSELTLGKIYDLEGNREKALQKYRHALKLEEIGNLRELASYYLNHPFSGERKDMVFLGTKADLTSKP